MMPFLLHGSSARENGLNLDQAGNRGMEVLDRTISGRLTAAETLRHDECVIIKLYRSA